MSITYKSTSVAAAIRSCATQRVDFVGIGDSNQLKDGTGWDHGWQYALSQLYPMYATGLITQNEGQGLAAAQGYRYGRISNNMVFGAASGAPSELDDYLNRGSGGLHPDYYTYVPSGSNIHTSTNNGLNIYANCPIGITSPLIFRFHYATFPASAGTGAFRLYVRKEDTSPFSVLAQSAITNPALTSYGMTHMDVQAPADPNRAYPIAGKWTTAGGQAVVGPFFSTYVHCINPTHTAGFAYSTLDARSGQPLRTMANDLQQASNTTLTHFFSILRTRQLETQASARVIITINSGVNDQNASATTSVGPNPTTPGDSQAAFQDNLQAIYNRIAAIWTLNGWPQSELYFAVTVSPPISNPDAAKLQGYRAACQAFCDENPRCAVSDFTQITDHAELVANSWYMPGPDVNHFTQPGYENLSSRVVNAYAAVPAIAAPAGTAAVAQNEKVVLSAIVPAGATGVRFFRNGEAIGTVSGGENSTVSYVDTALVNGTSYAYTATSLDDGLNSSTMVNVSTSAVPSVLTDYDRAEIAKLILADPANKILTDASGHVTATNGLNVI